MPGLAAHRSTEPETDARLLWAPQDTEGLLGNNCWLAETFPNFSQANRLQLLDMWKCWIFLWNESRAQQGWPVLPSILCCRIGLSRLAQTTKPSNFSSIIRRRHPSLEGTANFSMTQSTPYKDDYADARFGTTENQGNSPSPQMLVLPAIGYFSLETHLHSDPPLLTCSMKKEKALLQFWFYFNSSLYKHYEKANQVNR